MNMTEQTKRAIFDLYCAVAPDIPEDYESDDIGELLMDANRLAFHGHEEAEAEVKKLFKEHSFREVSDYVGKLVMGEVK